MSKTHLVIHLWQLGAGALITWAFEALHHEYICKIQASQPQRSTLNPTRLMAGLNIQEKSGALK